MQHAAMLFCRPMGAHGFGGGVLEPLDLEGDPLLLLVLLLEDLVERAAHHHDGQAQHEDTAQHAARCTQTAPAGCRQREAGSVSSLAKNNPAKCRPSVGAGLLQPTNCPQGVMG